MGYGTTNFTRSLVETYQRLAEQPVRDKDLQYISQLGEQIRTHPLTLMEGVQETLDYLLPHHNLFLLTKGDLEEQKLKVERSGIESYFKQVLIVKEKDVATYKSVLSQLELSAPETWMIGNAPRSDINPALASGLNAVYIPHPHTWNLEHEEVTITGPGKLLKLTRFSELRNHF
jgi:putative hydrolase of the HAD superfamily